MELHLQKKVLILFFSVIVGITLTFVWRTSSAFRDVHEASGKELSSRLSLAFLENTSRRLQQSVDELRFFSKWRDSMSSASSGSTALAQDFFGSFSEYLSLASLRRSTEGVWKTKWIELSGSVDTVTWSPELERQISSLVEKSNFENVLVTKITSPDTQSSINVMVVRQGGNQNSSADEVLVSVLSSGFLDSMSKPLKGSIAQFALLNSEGEVLSRSHSTNESHEINFLSLMEDFEKRADHYDTSLVQGSGGLSDYQLSRHQIPQTNLYGLVVVPVSELKAASTYLPVTLLALALGFVCLSVILLSRWFRGHGGHLQVQNFVSGVQSETSWKKQESVHRIIGNESGANIRQDIGEEKAKGEKIKGEGVGQNAPLKPDQLKPDQLKPDIAKLTVLQKLSEDIAYDLKNPLAAALGNIVLARSKSNSEEIHKHLEYIERGVREAKDLVEKIYRLNSLKSIETDPVDLGALLSRALADVSKSKEFEGLKVQKDMYSISAVHGHQGLLSLVLPQVLTLMARTLSRAGRREMVVRLEPLNASAVQITVGQISAQMVHENASLSQSQDIDLIREDVGFGLLLAVMESIGGRVYFRGADRGEIMLWMEFKASEEKLAQKAEPEILSKSIVNHSFVETYTPAWEGPATFSQTQVQNLAAQAHASFQNLLEEEDRHSIPSAPPDFLLNRKAVPTIDFYDQNLSGLQGGETLKVPKVSAKNENGFDEKFPQDAEDSLEPDFGSNVRVRRPRLKL